MNRASRSLVHTRWKSSQRLYEDGQVSGESSMSAQDILVLIKYEREIQPFLGSQIEVQKPGSYALSPVSNPSPDTP